ncbi:hypothetical protein AB0E77_08860 [Streptomyces sp. NPDC032940]|uniref:hypothetical protein n=1 Tax=Streptomyces sp. NPDC032940 TaxID=3155366 RepID=UPI0033F9AC55
MAGRIVAQQPYVAPGQDLDIVSGCLNERQSESVRRLFAQAAGERGTRPRPGEWLTALSDRGVIRLTAATPRTRPAVDHTVLDGRRDRTPIKLRDPGSA